MRRKLLAVIERSDGDNPASSLYDAIMILTIVCSLVPLAFKEDYPIFTLMDRYAVTVFILDYLLRLFTADLKLGLGWRSFLRYPFTAMAIIDLLAILPTFLTMFSGLRLLKVVRLLRALLVFRAFKLFRYSKNAMLIANVLRKQCVPLLVVGALAAAYVLLCALLMFNIEPDIFEDFFAALYWSTTSLITIGYGDIVPQTHLGQTITMLSFFFGIAIIALPSGIIAGGYLSELNNSNDADEVDVDATNTVEISHYAAEIDSHKVAADAAIADMVEAGDHDTEQAASTGISHTVEIGR